MARLAAKLTCASSRNDQEFRNHGQVLCGGTSAIELRSVVCVIGGSLTIVPVLPLLSLKLPSV
jgi:hypothetical protein